jgi:hypothetical protein
MVMAESNWFPSKLLRACFDWTLPPPVFQKSCETILCARFGVSFDRKTSHGWKLSLRFRRLWKCIYHFLFTGPRNLRCPRKTEQDTVQYNFEFHRPLVGRLEEQRISPMTAYYYVGSFDLHDSIVLLWRLTQLYGRRSGTRAKWLDAIFGTATTPQEHCHDFVAQAWSCMEHRVDGLQSQPYEDLTFCLHCWCLTIPILQIAKSIVVDSKYIWIGLG